MDTSDQQQQRAAPRLVKGREAVALDAFTPEQRSQLLAVFAERDEQREQAWRDFVQGLGAVMNAARRLAGLPSMRESRN